MEKMIRKIEVVKKGKMIRKQPKRKAKKRVWYLNLMK